MAPKLFPMLILVPVLTTGVRSQLDCNFDQDLCQWTQSTGAGHERHWIRHKGVTATVDTGPTNDHTTGTGYYMYIEASQSFPGNIARLLSPMVTILDHPSQCLTFWYHMNGATVGSLSVLTLQKGVYHSIWSRTGDQGIQWLEAKVSIASFLGINLQFVFDGITGSGIHGDIAIDDVSLLEQPCTTPYTTADFNPMTELTSTPEPTTTENLPLDIVIVDGQEYIKLPKPCNIVEHLCPAVGCSVQIRKLPDASHCFHCVCDNQGGTIVG